MHRIIEGATIGPPTIGAGYLFTFLQTIPHKILTSKRLNCSKVFSSLYLYCYADLYILHSEQFEILRMD